MRETRKEVPHPRVFKQRRVELEELQGESKAQGQYVECTSTLA